jgi:drug/metabolite transporter (DMT)-like permease
MADSALSLGATSMIAMVACDYRKGLALTAGGTILASFEGLLVRLVAADSWTVIFWRGLLLGLVMLAVIIVTGRKLHMKSLRWPAWMAVFAFGGSVFFFISAINATTVANTLVIASAAPLFAAALGWAALRERPTRETWVAVIVVFLGLAVIFSGSLSTSRIAGDVLALGYALSLAAYFLALQRCPEEQVPSIVALGGMLSGFLAWPFASSLGVAAGDIWALLLLGIIIVPAATLLLSLGPQYIPASHVTLVMLLEIGFGPLWVWLVFSEMPAPATFFGGALVLATIVAHSWFSSRQLRVTSAQPMQERQS